MIRHSGIAVIEYIVWWQEGRVPTFVTNNTKPGIRQTREGHEREAACV